MSEFKWLLLLMWLLIHADGQAGPYQKQSVTKDIKAYQSFLKLGSEVKLGVAPFVSMGTDDACDFDSATHSISDVVAMGVAEIRLASNGVYQDNISLDDIDIIIRGGFATCTAAENNQQVHSDLVEIDGSLSFMPVIHITGSSQNNLIRFENLVLTGGFATSGGGLFVEMADAEIHLLRFATTTNQAQRGGGISIEFGSVDLFGQDVLVFNNRALTAFGHGGGIYCSSALNNVTLTGLSAIHNNQAARGGGIYSSVCKINMYSRPHDQAIFFWGGVTNNSSTDVGGGLYLQGLTQVNFFGQQMCDGEVCLGSNRAPLLINDNAANLDPAANANGGGIFMESFALTPSFYANGIQMINNQAGGHGGAIYASQGASVIIERVSAACWEKDRCNLIEANQSSTDLGFGGAFYVDNSSLQISHAYIEANRADFGTALVVTGSDSSVTLEHAVLDDNGDAGSDGFSDNNVVRVSQGADVVIKHTTFADNDAQSSIFNVDLLPSSLELRASIVHESNGTPLFPLASGTLNIDCLVSHEEASFTGSHVLVADPLFVDRLTGDFHLSETSPAMDLCAAAGSNSNLDMDMQALGWDDPNIINGAGSFDAGADESYLNDVIFLDDFDG